ncbi:MAG: chorismate synthase [Chloroflexi bacterium]|nr:chorismate synthase [Chloroflexota bacterium]
MSNTLGKLFSITIFGESHGDCIGVVIDGCPAGLHVTVDDIQAEIDKRKAALRALATSRKEDDKIEFFSGMMGEYTTGAPICLVIWNKNIDSSDYVARKNILRPGHADFTANTKYGGFNDYRGGGSFSGRITAGFVMAGAIALKLLEHIGIEVMAHSTQIGQIHAKTTTNYKTIRECVSSNEAGCADLKAAPKMEEAIELARLEGDSLGGVIEGIALNIPVGFGEPTFDTLEGELAKALFSIPAVKGVEFGAGFKSAGLKGSQNNDSFVINNGTITSSTNNAGGVLGGISSGMPIIARVAIKPTPSILKEQPTVNIVTGKNTSIKVHGRHDPCIVPRAVPIVESMMAITLCDLALRAQIMPRVIK